ncbi:glycosyltransferase family 2 protein [Aquimarina pacifica]|uniref:glycosyltransferase family 2 protein n=1 Tax=Aquimarina pacifica TaxID=1296415 RepID=UPI00046F54DA|nr:glycosyltransferase family 2 protein [Aquimarina pacifica]
MKDQPLVTIIMAVKDTAPYLHDCLDSIIAQTYQNWELIAVNDHSSDASPQILQEYANKDPRIRFFNSDKPKLIPTLQVGYTHAKGTLINRMDSDDKMPDYKIQVLVDEWSKYGKGTVIAGGTEHFVDEGVVGDGFLRYEKWLNNVAKNSLHYQEIYRECVIPSHCWLLHKDDFDAVGAFDPIIYPEDYDLCFRFYRARLQVVGIDKILHYWRDRSNRISRTWDEYKDNRYFDLKLRFFYELDRDRTRPLVLWGAGRNGKDMAKLIQSYDDQFHWVCDNQKKIGKDIYGTRLEHYKNIKEIENPQIIIVVASPTGKEEIEKNLAQWAKDPVIDYWFFS